MKLSTDKALISAIILIGLAVAAIGYIAVAESKQIISSSDRVSHTEQVLLESEKVLNSCFDNESSARGFVLTGNKDFLNQLNISKSAIYKELNQLLALTRDNPGQQDRLDSLLLYIRNRIQISDQMVETYQQEGMTAAVNIITAGDGKHSMNMIRRYIRSIQAEENKLLLQRKEQNEVLINRMNIILLIVLGVIFLSMIVMIQKARSDLKARMKTEKTITYLAGLTEQTNDAFISTDVNLNIKSWNKGAEAIYGYSAAEAVGQNISGLIKSRLSETERVSYIRRLNKAGFHKNEFVFGNREGEPVHVLATITVLKDEAGSITGYLAVHKDITEQKKADQYLRESEERFRLLVNNVQDYAIFMLDPAGNIMSWNEGAQKIKKYTEEEIVGRSMKIFYDAEDLVKGEADRNLAAAKENGRFETEGWRVRKDGTRFWAHVSFTALHDDEGHHQGFAKITQDITDKKKAEETLKQFNEELSRQVEEKTNEITNVFERVTDAFVAVDLNWNYTYANPKAEELLKRPHKYLIGRNMWEEFPGAEEIRKTYEQAMRDQKVLDIESYYAPYDVWNEVHAYPSPQGLSLFFRDITEQKKAREQFVKEKELSDSIINSLPGIFYMFDAEGRFIRWNKRFETISGYSAEEIGKMHPLDFFDGDGKQHVAERIGEVFVKGESDAEADFVSKDGKRTPFYFTGSMITYEGKPGLLGVGTDITERKKSEEEMIASEKKYKLLFESNPLPMWMLSLPERDFIDVNEAAIKQYGYTKEEFLHMNAIQIRPVEDVERYLKQTQVPRNGTTHAGVWRHKRKDGSIINVDIITHNIISNNSHVQLVLANDVTERVKVETQIKETTEQLRELSAHLQEVREEERLRIAREIHDELGQQLTVLKMDVSWIGKKIPATEHVLQTKVKNTLDLLDDTVKSVRRLSTELRPSILDDIGLSAAIEWHSKEFEKRSGIQTVFRSKLKAENIPTPIATGFFRIYQESLTNVARHANASRIESMLEYSNDQISLTIQDNGKGFDVSTIHGKKTLGLLGMRERANMMNGHYQLTSEKGKGTIIKVSAPLPSMND